MQAINVLFLEEVLCSFDETHPKWSKHSLYIRYSNLCKQFVCLCQFYLGVLAIVQRGYVFCGGYKSKVHSMQASIPGRITLALPLKPSVPPSTKGITLLWSRLPEILKQFMIMFLYLFLNFSSNFSDLPNVL